MGKTKPQQKPYAEYPLTWHPQGYWCKRVNGKLHYFGTRNCGWEEALEEYKRTIDDIQLGREPLGEKCNVDQLCNQFLDVKSNALDTGELSAKTWKGYVGVCQMIIDHFGRTASVGDLRPVDFAAFRAKLGQGRSITTLANYVRQARIIFRFAETEELIPGRIRFGSQFSEPSRKSKKQHRNAVRQESGLRMFEAAEIRRLLFAASPIWRAMIYLGINCGYGNNDLSQFSKRHLGARVIEYPRPKTGEDRTSVLWPETVAAVEAAFEMRPQPSSRKLNDRVFLTRSGGEWVEMSRERINDEISKQFSKLLTKCGLKRPGINFYALRHTVVTVGEEIPDKPALSLMLGHTDSSMAAVYRERVSLERIETISSHILSWLGQPDNVREMSASKKF